MFRVSVYVSPKKGVADPQGAAVERALPALGHSGVRNIRVGRYVTLEVEGDDLEKVKADVDDMCRRLLANPIIEDYFFEIAPAGSESFSAKQQPLSAVLERSATEREPREGA